MTQTLATGTQIGPVQLASIVRRAASRPEHWLSMIRFDADSRWYRRLVVDEGYEVWLLSWLPG
jgi:hypothetical protein